MWSKAKADCSLYLVADRSLVAEGFLDRVEQALIGGVSVVQLRAKELSGHEFYALGEAMLALTARFAVPLLINDRLDIALALGAAGVHLGQQDLPAARARHILSGERIVGVSARTLAEAQAAAAQGADYIGAGAVFPTTTKSDAEYIPLSILSDMARRVSIPVLAIGGITAANAALVRESGASGLCVASGIMCAASPRQAAAELRKISDTWRRGRCDTSLGDGLRPGCLADATEECALRCGDRTWGKLLTVDS